MPGRVGVGWWLSYKKEEPQLSAALGSIMDNIFPHELILSI